MRSVLMGAVLSCCIHAADLAKLGFMSGCWATPAGAGALTTDEHWSTPASGNMLGYSRTFKGDRMVFFEFMRLEVKGDEIVYTPRYGTNQTPVPFRLTRLDGNEVVFQNPEHDFPQRIIYKRDGDRLLAAIEGTDKGRRIRDEFPYRKVLCP